MLFFKRVVIELTEVVLFSVVAFKTLDILQGSVATHVMCGGIWSDTINVPTKPQNIG